MTWKGDKFAYVYLCFCFLVFLFSCGFVTFQNGVLGQVLHLTVSIPDLCILHYFVDLPALKCEEIMNLIT